MPLMLSYKRCKVKTSIQSFGDFAVTGIIVGIYRGQIKLDLLKYLMIKTSEKSWTQRFDESMSSFSSEKRIKFDNLIYTVRGDKT